MRVLIAEDEKEVAKALKIILEKNRFTTDIVFNGNDALNYLLTGDYNLAVLDIMMPGMDGIRVLQEARDNHINIPVMMLTAKSEIEDRVTGLNAGADDYLSKPFATAEFLARVKALSRRTGMYVSDNLTLGNVSLDCGTYILTTASGEVRLNNKEFQLMELFLRNPGKIFSAGQLMDNIWGYDTNSGIDVVWTYISNIRRKLEDLEATIEIRTARGAGYSLELK